MPAPQEIVDTVYDWFRQNIPVGTRVAIVDWYPGRDPALRMSDDGKLATVLGKVPGSLKSYRVVLDPPAEDTSVFPSVENTQFGAEVVIKRINSDWLVPVLESVT